MPKENINKPNLTEKEKKVGGIVLPIVYDTNHQVSETLNLEEPKFIEIGNGNRLLISEVLDIWGKAGNAVIEKYHLNNFETNYFNKGLAGRVTNAKTRKEEKLGLNFKPDPEHPSWRGSSDIQCYANDDYSHFDLGAIIYVNPQMVYDKNSFFAVLFHELDHYAYKIKKYSVKMNETPKDQRRRLAMRINAEDEKQCNRFSTELLARVDTADELLGQNVDDDIIDRFGIGNEHETTGDSFYSDSITYARKFFNFQKGLYRLLARHYGLNSSKPKNNQLPETADKQFQTIMNRLRNEIFNSSSIERSKNVINESYRKLQESGGSWNTFCSLRK